MKTKTCCRCKNDKPPKSFYRRAASADGLMYHCIECDKEYQRKRRKEKRKPIVLDGVYSYKIIYNGIWGLWNDDIIAEAKIKAGVCPDCDNDKCMADGVTGLWCPSCDASYLLDTEANNGKQNIHPDVDEKSINGSHGKDGLAARNG